MPWSETLIYPGDTQLNFEKSIPKEEDQALKTFLEQKLQEMRTAREENPDYKPFLYFAIGTANGSANGTNPSMGAYVTASNIEKQRRQTALCRQAEAEGYSVVIINIDEFGEEDPIHFNGVYPIAGITEDSDSHISNSEALDSVKQLFRLVKEYGGKSVFFNAVADYPLSQTNPASSGVAPEFYLPKGVKSIVCDGTLRRSLVYVSSYLELRAFYNVYRFYGIDQSRNQPRFLYMLSAPDINFDEI